MISVSASTTLIRGGQDAAFTVTASPAPAQALTVFYNLSGTAVLGTDYTLDGSVGQITVAAGQTSTDVVLHAVPGQVHKKALKAIFQLTPRASYHVPKRAGKAATIKIAE
jgi:hypothetical protein